MGGGKEPGFSANAENDIRPKIRRLVELTYYRTTCVFASPAGSHDRRPSVARVICLVALVAVLCTACNRGRGGAQGNVVLNGDLASGSGDSPEDWHADLGPPGLSTLRWLHARGAHGELEVSNIKPNDAHWSQTLHLTPGWYHFTASMRAEGVPTGNAGANLSVLDDGIISQALSGTTAWQTVDFYLNVGKGGADVALACRLGGFSSLNTGKAFCRDVKGIKVPEPPADVTRRYDLDVIQSATTPPKPVVRANPPPRPLPVSAIEKSALHRASKAGNLLEKSLDIVDWAMALVILAATLLMAGASAAREFAGESFGRLKAWPRRTEATASAVPIDLGKGESNASLAEVAPSGTTHLLAPITALNVALLLCIGELVLLIGTKSVTFGSQAGGWTFGYYADLEPRPLLVGIGLSLALVPLVHLSLRLIGRRQLSVLTLWFVAGTAGAVLLHSLYIYSLGDIVRSDTPNGFYGASLRYNAVELLRHHEIPAVTGPGEAFVLSLPGHVARNMPGKLLLYQGLGLLTTDPRAIAILLIALSNLGGVFLYFIVSAIYERSTVGLLAFLLYLFIPGKIFFEPLLNIVSPVPMLGCLLILVRFLVSRGKLLALFLGAALYAAIFFDPLPLALGLFFVAPLARSRWLGEVRTADVMSLGLLSLAGFLAVHVVMLLGLHFDILRAFITMSTEGRRFNQAQGRPYAVWVWADLVEFFLNAGALPSVVCLVYLVALMLRAVRSRGTSSPDSDPIPWSRLEAGPVMLAALVVTVAVVDLLGINRGEVVRLWIFLMAFVQVVAAGFCWEKAGRWTFDIVLAGSIIQAAVTISMVMFILP